MELSVDNLFIASLIVIWIILLYHVILTYGGYKHFVKTITSVEPDVQLTEYPLVTVLIPAHNEEMVIGRTIDAIARLTYPRGRLEIIVVNDCSTDRTGDILAKKCEEYPHLKVVTLGPPNGAKGKSNALNSGLQASQGEYIVVYDADNTPERRAVVYLVDAIRRDEKLGAVVGKFRTRNRDVNLLTRFINVETLSFQWLLQAGRCYLFGLTTIPGTNFIIRRSLLDNLGGWKENALTEDTELTIRIYNSGYRIYWLPNAVTWEQEPETLRVWMKQRTRWAQGNMWVSGYYLSKLLELKDYRIRADIIYFALMYFVFFAAVIVSDAIFILGILGLVKMTVAGPFGLIWLLAYVLFIAETFITLSLERGEGTWKNIVVAALMYFTYSQLWIFVVCKASLLLAKRFISNTTDFHWYKTERSSR